MLSTFVIALTLFAAQPTLAPPPASSLVRAVSDEPFLDLKFDEALAAAKKDQKIVMIDFFTTWCVPCKKLDKITWKDESVQAWIAKTAVALKLDAEKEVELAKRFHVEGYPTIVFVNADGQEIAHLVGFMEPADFLKEAASALGGKDAVTRVKEKFAGHDQGPMARQAIADALADEGKHEKALAEYLWCFDHGAEADPSYVGVRLSFLVGKIASLGAKYPPATKALESRRDAAETALFSEKGSSKDAAELFSLNDALHSSDRNIAAWERLDKAGKYDSSMRMACWFHVVKPLIEAKRYSDAVKAAGDLAAKAKWQLETRPPKSKSDNPEMDEMTNSILNRYTVSTVGQYYEAAVGAGETKTADAIADQLIAFDPAYTTYVELIDRARRADALEAARSMARRGIAAVPEKDRPIVQDALKRIPDSK